MFTQMPLMLPQPHLMELLLTINNLLANSSIYFIVLYAMHRFKMYCVQHVFISCTAIYLLLVLHIAMVMVK